METLSRDWPLLAAMMALFTPILIFISRLYERMIDTAEERYKEAIDLGKESVRVIEALTSKLEDSTKANEQLRSRLEEFMRREEGRR